MLRVEAMAPPGYGSAGSLTPNELVAYAEYIRPTPDSIYLEYTVYPTK